MYPEMIKALEADGEKLRQLTGEDHGPFIVTGYVPCERCHGTGEIIISVGSHQCDTDGMLCSACEGYGFTAEDCEIAGIEHTEIDQ